MPNKVSGMKNRHKGSKRSKSVVTSSKQISQVDKWCRLGDENLAKGERKEALACYQQAYLLNHDLPGVRLNLVVILLEFNEEAEARQILNGFEKYPLQASQSYNALGVYEMRSKHPVQALQTFDKALQLNPENADAWSNRCNALSELQHFPEALDSVNKAVLLQPKSPDYHYNRGLVLQNLKRDEEALLAYERTLELDPKFPYTHLNTANIYVDRRDWVKAESSMEKALEINRDEGYILGAWLLVQMFLARWESLLQSMQEVLLGIDAGKRMTLLLPLLAMPATAAQQTHAAQIYVNDRMPDQRVIRQRTRLPGRIRIAYVSFDFGQHAVSILTAGLYEAHDRKKFEVFLYSTRHLPDDAMQQRLKQHAEHFVDVSQLRDDEVLALAREHDIDIAVDLNGHTVGAHTNLFAHGLAPVQINWLGYPASMGSPYHHYIIADEVVIPPHQLADYQEKVVYLPSMFQMNDDKRAKPQPTTRAAHGLPDPAVVLCSFNGCYKLNPIIFGCWMQIMNACPDSVLWLVSETAEVMQRLRVYAEQAGVSGGRLFFARPIGYQDHVSRLALADLALDSLPFNGGTTTSDALWCGVPVLTCTGDTLAGRMATSLLHCADLPELITNSLEQYVNRGIELVNNLELRMSLRNKILSHETRQRLFDTKQRTLEVEAAYEIMFKRHQDGLPPESFAVVQ